MPYIYRVENKEGKGCYRDNHPDLNFITQHTRDNGHPLPEHDLEINRPVEFGKEICGFLNLNQAQAWFSNTELMQLREHDFYLKRVKVEKIVVIGVSQVLAIRGILNTPKVEISYTDWKD